MKAAGKYSYDGTFGISSRGLGNSGKKSVFCPFDLVRLFRLRSRQVCSPQVAQGRLLSSIFCLLTSVLYGCSFTQSFRHQEPSYEKLSASYNQAKLKTNSNLDVLRAIREAESDLGPPLTETPLLSQNDTAIASAGRSKSGYETWVTLVAFDESANGGMAKRKHFHLVDEKARVKPIGLRRLQIVPKPGLIFDSKVVLSPEVLDKPYTAEEEMQIAILKQVADDFRKDIDGISHDNEILAISGMVMRQTFNAILMELDKSPSLARSLRDGSGVQFNHPNFDKGKIRMTIESNIVTVKIRSGVFLRIFDDQDLVKQKEK